MPGVKIFFILLIFIQYLTMIGCCSVEVTNAGTGHEIKQKRKERERLELIQINVDRKFYDTVKSWDQNVGLYTSKENPIESFESLRAENVAFFGSDAMKQALDFFELIGIKETKGMRIISSDYPIFSGMENPPRLYITSINYEYKLKGGVRIELILSGND